MDIKRCPKCGEIKTTDNFYTVFKYKKWQPDSYCIPCKSIIKAERKIKDRAASAAYAKRRNHELKATVYTAYGNKCACCGENEQMFLSIDHVNNDGAEHRRSLTNKGRHGIATTMYRQIIKDNFSNRYQLLCYNCNCGKQRNNGVCPHLTKGSGI